MPVTEGPEIWTKFWQEFSPENEPTDRCFVPGDGRGALDKLWAQFAADLPPDGRVIDLGCGGGVVGSTLLSHRPDLHISGVDWAHVPMPDNPNLTIHAPVRMEALPFDDHSFDAAVSQFGIEYGKIVKTVQELQRVLAVGAPFCFLVHHRDSEIVREGSMRRRALEELMAGQLKSAFLSGSAQGIEDQKRRLRQQFPAEPMVKLVSDYFHRNIARTPEEKQAIWQKLFDELGPEIALLHELDRSAKSATELDTWLVDLQSAMNSVSMSVVRQESGEPIAWHVQGER